MRNRLIVVALVLSLTGCAGANPPPAPIPTAPPDLSVSVANAESVATAALTAYVARTNEIVSGDAAPESIAEVTSAAWSTEEIAGFAALSAIGSTVPPTVAVSQFEVARVRGAVSVVDVFLHVCFDGGGVSTLATVHLVPRAGTLVVDNIRPWEDASWCEPELSFSS